METFPSGATAVADPEIVAPPARRGKPTSSRADPGAIRPSPDDARTFDAHTDAIAATAAFVEAFCERGGITPGDTLRLTLIVEELFTNIVTHGYGAATGGTVRFALALDGRDIAIYCEDSAPAYDPRPALTRRTKVPGEPVETRAPGGFGQVLVGHLIEAADYARVDGANRLVLRFRRRDAER